jgi:hypothetical protein
MADVAYWRDSEVPALFAYVGYRGKSGHAVDITAMTEFDPSRPPASVAMHWKLLALTHKIQ